MKTCPVCKSHVFDDMDVCYGCMHRFEAMARRRRRKATPGCRRWRQSSFRRQECHCSLR